MSNASSPARSVLGLIGGAPQLEPSRTLERRGLQGRLLAKLETANPGGSKKDRAALELIRCAK